MVRFKHPLLTFFLIESMFAKRKLTAKGKLGHSGFPHRAINAIELVARAAEEIQRRFRVDFKAHPKEEIYLYGTPSSLKATRMVGTEGALNQVCVCVYRCLLLPLRVIHVLFRFPATQSCRETFDLRRFTPSMMWRPRFVNMWLISTPTLTSFLGTVG